MKTIRVANFTQSPGGRFVSDGAFSGEWFRQDVLMPALLDAVAQSDAVSVEFDGTSGYGSSFLEEAFGGLVRLRLFDAKTLRKHLQLKSGSPLYDPYRALAEKYIETARPQVVAA